METHLLRPTPDLRNQELRGQGGPSVTPVPRSRWCNGQAVPYGAELMGEARPHEGQSPSPSETNRENHYGMRGHLRQGHSSNLRTRTRTRTRAVRTPSRLSHATSTTPSGGCGGGERAGRPWCLPVAGHHADALTRLSHIQSSQKDMAASLQDGKQAQGIAGVWPNHSEALGLTLHKEGVLPLCEGLCFLPPFYTQKPRL